jgi:hypothetical protein
VEKVLDFWRGCAILTKGQISALPNEERLKLITTKGGIMRKIITINRIDSTATYGPQSEAPTKSALKSVIYFTQAP